MKTHLILTILFLLALFLNSCSEQPSEPEKKSIWEKVSDTPGTIRFVQAENNNIYATCYAAVNDLFIVSSDFGKTWQISDLGTSIYENGFLNFKENRGFVSCHDGMYRSEDYGLSWYRDTVLINHLEIYVGYPPVSLRLNEITFKGNSIYIGFLVPANWDIQGIIRSIDEGNNWYSLENSPWGIWDLACTESNIVVSHLGKIYYSNDDCETWIEAVGEFGQYYSINDIYQLDSRIFGLGDGNNIYYSDNGGEYWLNCSDGIPSYNQSENNSLDVSTFTSSDNYLFILRDDGVIYYTRKDNFEWKIFNDELPAMYYWNLFVVEDYLYYSSSNELWRTKIPN